MEQYKFLYSSDFKSLLGYKKHEINKYHNFELFYLLFSCHTSFFPLWRDLTLLFLFSLNVSFMFPGIWGQHALRYYVFESKVLIWYDLVSPWISRYLTYKIDFVCCCISPLTCLPMNKYDFFSLFLVCFFSFFLVYCFPVSFI